MVDKMFFLTLVKFPGLNADLLESFKVFSSVDEFESTLVDEFESKRIPR